MPGEVEQFSIFTYQFNSPRPFTMLRLGIGHFFHARRKTEAAAARTTLGHVAFAGAVVATLFNVRLGVWLASAHEMRAETCRLRPLWLFPLLTVAVVVWSAGLWLFISRRSRRASQTSTLTFAGAQ